MSDEFNPVSLEEKLAAGPRPARVEDNPLTPAAKSFQKDSEEPIYDWLKQFSGASVKVTLIRLAPEMWDGHQTAGVLEHFDELSDNLEEEVRNRFGGGRYQVKVQKLLPNGRWNYAGAKSFKVAGDPRITGDRFQIMKEEPLPPQNNEATQTAMHIAKQMVEAADARAERAENRASNSGQMSDTLLAIVTEPLKMQIQTLSAQLVEKERIITEKDKVIHELSNKKPDTIFQDTIAGKLLDGETSRIEAIRTQHESERRQLIQSHSDEIKRVQDRQDYDIKRVEDSHKREIQNLRDSQESRVESLKTGYEGRLDAKDNRLKDLERDLNKTHVELAELRSKKDKSITEQMSEIAALKENLTMLGFSKEESEEDDSVMDRIIEVAGPIIKGVGARLEQGPALAPPPQLKRRLVKAGPRKVEAPKAAPPTAADALGLDPATLAMAIGYIEQGVTNGIPPEMFAQSARNMVPINVLATLKDKGVDVFLDEIAAPHISLSSPLTTQIGRTFVRKVARYLLTESTEPAAPAEPLTPPTNNG